MEHKESSPPFPNAPLAIVAFEVRYPKADPASAAGPMREMLRAALPLVDHITHNRIELRPDAPAIATQRQFPRFVTRDKTTALAVNDDATVLETTSYAGYTAFRALAERCLDAIGEALRPDGVTRIGLRFVDEVRVSTIDVVPGDWRGWINHHLLAPVTEEFLAETELTPQIWQGVVQYSTGPDSVLALRYGPGEGHAVEPNGPTRRRNAPAAGPFFLLDTDSWWEAEDEVPEFDPQLILERCDRLHRPARAIFDAATTSKLRDEVFSRTRDDTEVKT